MKKIILTISCVVLSYTAHAQTPSSQAQDRNTDVIQRFEQERLQEDLKREIQREQNALQNRSQTATPEIQRSGVCIDVNQITLKGVSLYSSDHFNRLLISYEGRCLYMADIQELANTLNQTYMDDGYVTSRAYIPAQDLSDGVLEINIIEGRIEEMQYERNGETGRMDEVNAAFGFLQGDFLNLRDIEQGLDQMNRLQSNNVKMDLLPGTIAGGSIIAVQNNKSKSWHGRFGVDNSGSESTGEWQGHIGGTFDNPLGLSDLFDLTFKHDLEGARRRQSRNVSARYEVPLGRANIYYALSFYDYISRIITPSQEFKTTGHSRVHDIGAKYVLHRDQTSKTNISGSIVAKENENYLESTLLTASSRKLTILNLSLSHSKRIENGFIYAGVSAAKGIGLFGAKEDNGLPPESPQAEFSKVTADINIMKLWDLGWGTYNPRMDFSGRTQWSADTLFGSEQISAGGEYSVRGFKEASISGDTGLYGKIDLSIPYSFENNFAAKYFGQIRAFMGVDQGIIKSDKKLSNKGGTLRSWSVGLRNESAPIAFSITYSKPFSSPAYVEEESHDLYIKLSASF